MSTQIRTMSRELTEDSFPIETRSRSLIMKVKDFSNETVHKSGELVDSSYSSIKFRHLGKIYLVLFANGMTSDDKGYVTVEIRIASNIFKVFGKVFELSCVFRVIDASGIKRFPQSCVIHSHSYWSSFDNQYVPIIVDRLLERDFLLSDKDDLLPGDCLSLHIDVDMRTIDHVEPYIVPAEETNYVLGSFLSTTAKEMYLLLDSEIGRRLAEVSAYFQRMLETPMVETKSRLMKVANDEIHSLRDVGRIVMGAKSLRVYSISGICQMYITADKYDIPITIESCRNLLTTMLLIKNDPCTEEHVKENIISLLELAERYNDLQLKENIESFLKNNGENGEYDSNLETGWKFERVGEDDTNTYYFRFIRNINDEKSLLDYYN